MQLIDNRVFSGSVSESVSKSDPDSDFDPDTDPDPDWKAPKIANGTSRFNFDGALGPGQSHVKITPQGL